MLLRCASGWFGETCYLIGGAVGIRRGRREGGCFWGLWTVVGLTGMGDLSHVLRARMVSNLLTCARVGGDAGM